jgi:putative PIN family toxin of toxin-antitoxin system
VRAVLDTNVFVSGVFFTGPPYRILDAWRKGLLTLVVSPEILEEYRRVGHELSEGFEGVDLSSLLALLVTHAEVIKATPLPVPVCRDPDDDKFLACAIAADAEVIVSGDKDLLAIDEHRGVRILKPRDFVEQHL